MVIVRLLLLALGSVSGLLVLTQVPAAACSCAPAGTAEHVDFSDVVFLGTLAEIEETPPGDDGTIGSGDPVRYSFDVEHTFKGDGGDAVVESARFGASCGLEGMKIDQTYVVFATEGGDGLEAGLCGGTSRATPKLVEQVEAALSSPDSPPGAPTATDVPAPVQPVPTQVPSGVDQPVTEDGGPAWIWFGGGVLLAMVAGGIALRPRKR